MRFDRETHTVHAGGHSWQADPAHTVIKDDWYGEMEGWTGSPDYGHRTRRCCVRFESGWEASIIWGSGTYSTNHDAWDRNWPFTEEPTSVEVGVCDHTGELRMRRHTDDDIVWHEVESFLDDAALVELLDRLAELPTDYDYGEPPPLIGEVVRLGEEVARMYAEVNHQGRPEEG